MIDRYSIGDRTPGLKTSTDGSLAVLLQPEDAGADHRANWLPMRKVELFWLIVRACEPRGAMKGLSWAGPELVKLT